MDACRTAIKAVSYGLSRCLFLMALGCANPLFAEETPGTGRTADRSSAELSSAEVNEAVLAYQNLGQFQGNVYVTRNFRVRAANSQLAQVVGDRAEGYRELLAKQWLGQPIPHWPQPCPIEVTVSNQAYGETSFLLSEDGNAPPADWEMQINGPTDRLLDSVLPHEITHTIFASYFKQRLPRWADEGACTTIEHASEREKIHALLIRYLSPQQRQGIPFNRMFPMRDYPSEMLPLYAQGYSVARFLIAQGGHRQFVQLVERGLQHETRLPVTVAWDQAMREIYGYEDLSELQLDWLKWVGEGSQDETALARMEQRRGIGLASLQTPDGRNEAAAMATFNQPLSNGSARTNGLTGANGSNGTADENFYVQQMRAGLSAPAPQANLSPAATTPAAINDVPGPSAVAPLPSSDFSPIAAAGGPSTLGTGPTPKSFNSPAPVGQPSYRSDSTILLPQRLR